MKYFIFPALLLFTSYAFAQGTLVMNNKTKIKFNKISIHQDQIELKTDNGKKTLNAKDVKGYYFFAEKVFYYTILPTDNKVRYAQRIVCGKINLYKERIEKSIEVPFTRNTKHSPIYYYYFIEKNRKIEPLDSDENAIIDTVTRKETIEIVRRAVRDNSVVSAEANNFHGNVKKIKSLLEHYNLLEFTPAESSEAMTTSKVIFFRQEKDQAPKAAEIHIGDKIISLVPNDYKVVELPASIPLKACVGDSTCSIIEVLPLETHFEVNQDVKGETSLAFRTFDETDFYIQAIKRSMGKSK